MCASSGRMRRRTPRPSPAAGPTGQLAEAGVTETAMPLTRADLQALPSYVPGRSPADLARELGLPAAIKLASNEVAFGPLPGVVEAVAEAASEAHRYPDMGV